MIPMLDLSHGIMKDWNAYIEAAAEVLHNGQFILGPNVKAFEEEIASYLGVQHAVGVNSGTDALSIALRASGVLPGDEVVTTPFTFFATAESISAIGATPVFADIDPITLNLDPKKVEGAITDHTKAILPVHLFGRACAMDSFESLARQNDLRIVEDVAQAMGGSFGDSMLGSIGDVGAFSFFPTKNLGGFGDGGLVATDDDEVAALARSLRQHGSRPGDKYHNERIGYNSRLDELQAALLRIRLRRLDADNEDRRRVAGIYTEAFSRIDDIIQPEDDGVHVYHQYTIRTKHRNELQAALKKAGIASAVYYKRCVHQMPVFESGSFPHAEAAAREVLSLPIWPGMVADSVEAVHNQIELTVAGRRTT